MQQRCCYGIDLRASVKVRKLETMTTDSEPTGGQATAQDTDQPVAGAGAVAAADTDPAIETVMRMKDVSVYYGDFRAVRNVDMPVYKNHITAMIGPSGCGKSTVLRSLNRMNDLITGARVEGLITYLGIDLYGDRVDPVEVRRRIGMVFQKPNPFPKSITENVLYGPKIAGMPKKDFPDIIESSLRKAAIWDEVKDRLEDSALGLSGGQQQRLCIARAIATKPDVLLMDEPCSALDPIATGRIEDLMQELKSEYSITIVTHNMQQAARVSDYCGFFTTELDSTSDRRTGQLVEFDLTDRIFSNPSDERTENYVTGRFG